MSIEKIKNPLTKILNRLNSLQENQALSMLDKEYLSKLMIEAFDHLHASEEAVAKESEPPKNNVFQFDESQPATSGLSQDSQEQELGTKEANSPKNPEPQPKKEEEVEELEKPEPEAKQNTQEGSEEEEPSEKKQKANASDELLELFHVKESTELSERLSQMPINDIWNAMGLNERIFTQNELFGGDQETFRSTVQQLNKMEDFNDAKRFLIDGVADKYSWANEGRRNIAKNFVRLIKRKFK